MPCVCIGSLLHALQLYAVLCPVPSVHAWVLSRLQISVCQALNMFMLQVEEWGTVEAGHDLDTADVTTRVSAPSIFVRLLKLA